jgi:hypothetical protein
MSQDFAMYTQKGNDMVQAVVERAKRNYWTWPMTYGALEQLSRNHPDLAGEATDTAVREVVYNTLGFDTPFYI